MTLRRPVRLRPGEGCDSPSEEPSTLSLSELLNAALDEYSRATDVDPRDRTNPFVQQLEQCSMTEADILDILQNTSDSITGKRQGPEAMRAIRKMLKPIVGGLCVILDASAETASSVGVPGGKGIFAVVAVLVKTADHVSASYDNLEKLFARLTMYVERLQVRLQAPMEQGSAKIAVKALVELLKAFELATKTMQRGRIRQFLHALVSKADGIQSALGKLEDITTADERMSIAEIAVGTQDISCDLQTLRNKLLIHTTSFDEARPIIERTDGTVQATLIETQLSNSKLDAILAMLQMPQNSQLGHALPDDPRARGDSLWARFKARNLADIALLDESIQATQTAVKLSSGSEDSQLFSDLGSRLETRFELRGDLEDLNGGISAFERAVDLTADGDPDKIPRLNSLGFALLRRSRVNPMGRNAQEIDGHCGMIALTESIQAESPQREFKEWWEVPSFDNLWGPSARSVTYMRYSHLLPSFGLKLYGRTDNPDGHNKHGGGSADLELAISTFRRALELAPDDHPLRPTLLDNLNAALRARAAFGD